MKNGEKHDIAPHYYKCQKIILFEDEGIVFQV